MSGDDDALRWEGDESPSPEPPPRVPPSPAADAAPTPEPESAEPSPGIGNVALIAYGMLGGIYALWTVGWILGTGRVRDWIVAQPGSIPDPMFQVSAVCAVLAPALWYAASLFLTRGGPAWRRFVALAFGALVLVPWPFVTVGVIGS